MGEFLLAGSHFSRSTQMISTGEREREEEERDMDTEARVGKWRRRQERGRGGHTNASLIDDHVEVEGLLSA